MLNRALLASSVLALVLCACPPPPPDNDGGFKDGGGGGGGNNSPWLIVTVDPIDSPSLKEISYLAMAIDKTDKVGLAYFVNDGTFDGGMTQDGGTTATYDVRYVEWSSGQTGAIENIAKVQRTYGISVAFQPTGQPAVAFLGGGSDMSAFWFQSDAVVAYRAPNGGWTQRTTATQSTAVACGSPLDIGFLVGLWPALGFDSTGKAYLAWRDGHNGQFPQQDWAGSDLKLSEGGPTNWNNVCLQSSGNTKQAYGARINLVMAGEQPALVHDQAFGGADTVGRNIIFQKRNANGTWSTPATVLNIANTQSGGSLAWDPDAGFGIAAIEKSSDTLQYTSSKDGTQWSQALPIFGGQSGGWYPSLAFDPKFHEPSVAFYNCANRTGVSEITECVPGEDALMVMSYVGNAWQTAKEVDPAGGYLPKLGFFSNGKKVIAYRDPRTGVLKLAVEK